jgi:hypothetical protein
VTLEAALGARFAADQAMTADRSELSFLVPRWEWQGLVQYFDEWLPSHSYRGEGENPLPAPQHFVTTVYFDTPTRRLLDAARTPGRDNVKLRAKEYYDVHPSLAELATSVEDVVHAPGELWFELKHRSGVRTQKHRVRLSKGALWSWLGQRGEPSRADYVGREADARVLQQFLDAEPEPLEPISVVNYQRCSWQSDDGELRVTLDSNLAFYAPTPQLFERRSLLREGLGSACSRETRALLEVKHRGATLPSWLSTRLLTLGLSPSDYSKFVSSGSAVEAHAAALAPKPHV